MDTNFIILGTVLSIILIWCLYSFGRENYQPIINSASLDTKPPVSPESVGQPLAPWLLNRTPMPNIPKEEQTQQMRKLLKKSVDPGAHLECENWCKNKSGKGKSEQFMQVCIDTCIQERWRKANSKLTEFKP